MERLMSVLTAVERATGQVPQPRLVDAFGTLRWSVIVCGTTFTIQPWTAQSVVIGYLRGDSHYLPIVGEGVLWRYNPDLAIVRIVEFFVHRAQRWTS